MKTLLFILIVIAPNFLIAGYLDQGCGNTRPQAPNGVGSTVNFAVMNTQYAELGDSWGTGYENFNKTFVPGLDAEGESSPRLDARAKYLYLYQVVNDGAYEMDVPRVSLKIYDSAYPYITSWGTFTDLGLADTKDGEEAIQEVSILKTFGVPAVQEQYSKPSVGVTGPAVVNISGEMDAGINPTQVVLLPNVFYAKWEKPLPLRRRGTLYGFTTDLPPVFDATVVHAPKPKR